MEENNSETTSNGAVDAVGVLDLQSKLTEKQKTRLKYLASRAGVPYEEAVAKNMSQRKLKKMASQEKYQQILKSKRKEEKDRRKKFRKEKREKGEAIPRAKKPHVLMKDSSNKVIIAIDLNFGELMIPKDIKKLRKQVLRCYSFNRASESPAQLYLTSCSSSVKETFRDMKCGFENWDIHMEEKDFFETFKEKLPEKTDIVYLTRDSDNVLPSAEEIKKDEGKKVYIIGGLVDHNLHKGLTLKIAEEKGLSHARLPIDEHMRMCKSQVLTVNHVFELMLLVSQGVSWSDALQSVIPQRKVHPSCKPVNDVSDCKSNQSESNESS